MQTVLWLAVLVTGLIVAVTSSRWSVGHLTQFAARTKIPPFLIGITLVSIGTDLPEIANSIVSSLTGHGDINIGDSIGSAMVQVTLILGLLPIITHPFPISRKQVGKIGLATVSALVVGGVLMVDGDVSRLDATVLLVVWVAGTVLIWRESRDTVALPQPATSTGSDHHLLKAMFGLVMVGLGATTAIQGLARLAEIWSMPEYLIAFVLASLGTSLPELTVEISAIRRGQWDMAVGDAIGSSFVDATLSLAIGPLIAPILVSSGVAVVGSLVAAAAVGVAILVLVQRKEHNRISGVALIGLFFLGYLLITSLG